MTEELQVRRDDLAATRIASREATAIADGEVRARVEAFALTANNITYGVVGEKIGYWNFFPAPAGWGVIPVWGFAQIVESRRPDVGEGERLYGYFPMASHVVMTPGKLRPERLFDAAPHRSALPPVYNAYARVAREGGYDPSTDEERMLLFPLYATSFCIFDYLLDRDWFGAEQAVIVSASSKTAIGLAYAMADDPSAPRAIGLTSARNADQVRALSLYDDVAVYDDLGAIDARTPTVVIDMSGAEAVIDGLEARLGDAMRYCLQVGVTHHEATADFAGRMSERRSFFFAPAHIQKRAADWGPGAFDAKALDFWRSAALRSRSWLKIERVAGARAIETAFHRLRAGEIAPDRGLICSF